MKYRNILKIGSLAIVLACSPLIADAGIIRPIINEGNYSNSNSNSQPVVYTSNRSDFRSIVNNSTNVNTGQPIIRTSNRAGFRSIVNNGSTVNNNQMVIPSYDYLAQRYRNQINNAYFSGTTDTGRRYACYYE